MFNTYINYVFLLIYLIKRFKKREMRFFSHKFSFAIADVEFLFIALKRPQLLFLLSLNNGLYVSIPIKRILVFKTKVIGILQHISVK